MGYLTRITGYAGVTPPLVGDELKQFKLSDNECWFLEWEVNEELVEAKVVMPQGRGEHKITVPVPQAEQLVATQNQGKAYTFDEDLKLLIRQLIEAGHEVIGEFVGTGEDHNDVWRIRIDSRSQDDFFVKEKAIITWPDGTKVEGI